jgi:hypothetical protein
MIAVMKMLNLLLLLACTACSAGPGPASGPASAPAPAPAPSTPEAGGGLLPQIRALAVNASCTASSQCHTLALGARACGGPESYLAYSDAATPADPLRALAARYAEQRRAENAKSGIMSTCQMLVDPGAVCQAGSCQLRTAPAGAT